MNPFMRARPGKLECALLCSHCSIFQGWRWGSNVLIPCVRTRHHSPGPSSRTPEEFICYALYKIQSIIHAKHRTLYRPLSRKLLFADTLASWDFIKKLLITLLFQAYSEMLTRPRSAKARKSQESDNSPQRLTSNLIELCLTWEEVEKLTFG